MENARQTVLEELNKAVENNKKMGMGWEPVQTMYHIERAYKSKAPKEEILEVYKQLQNKEAVDHYNKSFLHIAAFFADHAAVSYLLEQGLKPALKDNLSRTPLHYLADAGSPFSYDNSDLANKEFCDDIEKTAQVLIDARASVLLRDTNRDELCYHLAARHGNLAFINALIKNKSKLDMADRDGDTILHLLITNPARSLKHNIQYARDEEQIKKSEAKIEEIFQTVKMLLELGLDPASKDSSQKTPADYAVENELGKLAVLLKGEYDETDPSMNDKIIAGGKTLHQACKDGDVKAVEALIRLGADINEVSTEYGSNGFTPLAMACAYTELDCINALLNAGADANFRSGEEGRSAMYFMMSCGNYSNEKHKEKIITKIMRALFDHKLDINGLIDENEDTAVIYSCSPRSGSGHNYGTLKQLIREELFANKNCNLNAANKNGQTALMNIVLEDMDNIENDLVFLLENGADLGAKDKEGNTALMYAARNRKHAVAKTVADLMFSFGDPLPKAVNNEGKSAMDIAVEQNNEDLVKYLLTKM